MDLQLTGKRALVTGSARGLGRATALALAREGADVAVADLNDPEAVATEIRELGRTGLAATVDVADEQQVAALFHKLGTAFGGLDILVNNAGVSQLDYTPTVDMDLDQWDRVMAVNVRGTFLCCRQAARMMSGTGGSIVNISSTAGITGVPRAPAYCASKGAVIVLTRSLALEWAGDGIRVNAVAPHYLDTDLTTGLRSSDKVYRGLTRQIPLRRFGHAEEVVASVLLLASGLSGFTTGSVLTVDGGYLSQ